MAVTWQIDQLEYELSDGVNQNVVKTVHWRAFDEDVNGNRGEVYGSHQLGAAGNPFIAYESLTPSIVLGWLHSAMGVDAVANYESMIAQQIAEKASPTIGSGLPW